MIRLDRLQLRIELTTSIGGVNNAKARKQNEEHCGRIGHGEPAPVRHVLLKLLGFPPPGRHFWFQRLHFKLFFVRHASLHCVLAYYFELLQRWLELPCQSTPYADPFRYRLPALPAEDHVLAPCRAYSA